MKSRVFLPSQLYTDGPEVLRIETEITTGSNGAFPHQIDGGAARVPGILTHSSAPEREVLGTLVQGVRMNKSADVDVLKKRAIGSTSLERLREAIALELAQIDAQEQAVRSAMAQLDSGFMRRFVNLTDD